MILIVTANSSLGNAVARKLLTEGHAVRGLVRSPEKGAELAKLGAEIVTGDLRQPDSLRRACEGASAVVAAAHAFMSGWGNHSKLVDDQGHRDLIDAAIAAGVDHFVYTSALGARPDHPVPFVRIKAGVEEYLQRSRIDYTIIRPSAFMEAHAHMLIGQPLLEKGKVSLFGRGESPRNFVSVVDVAEFVVIALLNPRAKGEIIEVGGPGNYTNRQVAELYARGIDGDVKIGHMPRFMLRTMSTLMRPFQPGMSQIMRYALLDDVEGSPFDPTPTLEKYPVELMELEDFVQQQLTSAA